VTIALALPAGHQVTKVTVFAPGRSPQALKYEISSGADGPRLQATLPELSVYAGVLVQ
jgi:hypothetical protein